MAIPQARGRSRQPHGLLVAALLAGAWRAVPPELTLAETDLSAAAPLLVHSGAGALVWRRLRQTAWQQHPAVAQLQQVYRRYALETAISERDIKNAFALLRAGGVEPVLVKGWAAARSYAEPYLRPLGDIDLCVRPEQYTAMLAALNSPAGQTYGLNMYIDTGRVDPHQGFSKLDDRDAEELYARTRLVQLGETEVRVLSPEDHLRILCVHLLRHGAWRPLWLCDVAAALEARPADFDWQLCLGRNPRRADWVACALGLAHQLLGARVDDTPIAERAQRLPRWLAPHVLRLWGEVHRDRVHMRIYARDPLGAVKELRYHWPDPIEATINVRGALNDWPRLPLQLGEFLTRVARFARQWPHLRRAPQP